MINTTIPLFGFTPANIILYGQNQTYVATVSVPVGSSVAQGNIQFLNGSAVLTTAPLSIGTTQGNNVVSFLHTAQAPHMHVGHMFGQPRSVHA